MIILPNRRAIERPAWVFPWATAQADFAEGRFWRAAFDQRQFAPRSQSFFHDSGASNSDGITTAPMRNGKLKIFGQGTLRITDMGLWSESGDTNYLLHSRDLSITHQVSATSWTGTFQNGETVTFSGGGTGTYVLANSILTSTPRLYAIRGGSGTLTGTMTGSTSGATATLSASRTVWEATNVSATRNQPGCDWRDTANAATLLTATANDATIQQSVTMSSGLFTAGARIRRNSGSSPIYMSMDNWSTQTDITAQVNGTGFSPASIATQTLSDPKFGIKIASSGDSFVVDAAQGVDRNFLPTPLLNTAIANTRTINRPAINTEGAATSANQGVELIRSYYSDSALTIFVEYAGYGQNGVGSAVNLIGGTGAVRCSAGVCGEPFSFGDITQGGSMATTANSANAAGIANLNRAMGTVDGNSRSCLNGGAVASGTASNRSGKFYYSHMVFGGNGDGTANINGRITRFAIGNTKVANGRLIEDTRF